MLALCRATLRAKLVGVEQSTALKAVFEARPAMMDTCNAGEKRLIKVRTTHDGLWAAIAISTFYVRLPVNGRLSRSA